MIKYIFIIFFVFIAVKAIAGTAAPAIVGGFDYVLPAPPKTSDPVSLYQYFNTIYGLWGTIQVTNTAPNGGVVDASYGNIAIYYDGTNYWLCIQTAQPRGANWVGTKLGSVS